MARAKKVDNANKAEQEKIPDKKTAKKVDKVTKPKPQHPKIAVMVKRALNELKNRKGCSLAAIRTFVTNNYDVEMNKQPQNLIKKFMTAEFAAGRIKMTNDDKESIDFQKRFNVVEKYEE